MPDECLNIIKICWEKNACVPTSELRSQDIFSPHFQWSYSLRIFIAFKPTVHIIGAKTYSIQSGKAENSKRFYSKGACSLPQHTIANVNFLLLLDKSISRIWIHSCTVHNDVSCSELREMQNRQTKKLLNHGETGDKFENLFILPVETGNFLGANLIDYRNN